MEDQTERKSKQSAGSEREQEEEHPEAEAPHPREKDEAYQERVLEESPDQNAMRYVQEKIQQLSSAYESQQEEKHPTTSVTETIASTATANLESSLSGDVQQSPVTDELPARTSKEAESWLVAVDGSEESEWAFNNTLNHMNLQLDTLYVLSITWKRMSEEDVCRKVLLKFGRSADKCQVKHCHLLLGIHRDVGDGICHVAKMLNVKTLVLGHRQNAGWLDKTLGTSISKHCFSQSQCTVVVVRHPTQIENSVLSQARQPFSRTFGLTEEEAERRIPEIPPAEEEVTEILMKQLVVGEKTYQVQIFLDVLGKKA